MIPEIIHDFFSRQLSVWEEAKENYETLETIEKKVVISSPYPIYVQFNPRRIRSTNADLSVKTISERKCFLCDENRPPEQLSEKLIEGYNLLVNPFPIFPYHLTISSVKHVPQDRWHMEMIDLAYRLKGMVIFFNGASSGASAPDHLHFQAVPKKELPLMNYIENNFNEVFFQNEPRLISIFFKFFSGMIRQDINFHENVNRLYNTRPEDMGYSHSLSNVFFWVDSKNNLRYVIIPRIKHRPDCFFYENDSRLMVSPGSIDLAGVIITPQKEDYEKISSEDILKIFDETVGF